MNRRRAALIVACAALATGGCEQLGNPEQMTTGPTVTTDDRHELVTTTHSFRNPTTIRRIVADTHDRFAYADPSIGPDQTLTVVTVAPRRLRPIRPGPWVLVTRFELPGGRRVDRRWRSVEGTRLWEAAFALPAAPVAASTTVAP